MSTVIETGKTVEEALEKALIALGRSKDEVDYEVLEQPSRGFFGLFGGHMARLRVTEKQEDVTSAAPAATAAAPAGAQPAASASAAPAAGTPRARAEQFLRDIFRCMGLTVAMSARETDEGYVYDLSGESLGILIGKHGQTLDALQYLTNLAANRGCEEGRIHVILDVEGYRSRREETLRRLAGHLAEKACRIHAEVRLEPMNRHERKIIHMALQDNYRVSTYSDGDEPYRCVVIAPKRRRRYQRDWSRERGED
ncbi:RNA-binding cell elongation regulator Jag/EloR [Selenomonas bovis]|uniref:RNA-binding cell elongation regulator Jag/EloR n=1 Tax=Selenomonas bovis TaxID=416586 RepID=UPI000374C24F|nr:RNA-binding cell elongation regulator Jag/EloR [Selenomonas bovis]